MSSRKELAGVRIDICSLREALHKIEHYLASEGLHAVETFVPLAVDRLQGH